MNILIWKGSHFPDAKFRDSFQEEKATVWWNLKDLYKSNTIIRLILCSSKEPIKSQERSHAQIQVTLPKGKLWAL